MDLASRKFILAIALILLSFSLVVLKIESHEHWLEFAKWIFGIYSVANVADKFAPEAKN